MKGVGFWGLGLGLGFWGWGLGFGFRVLGCSQENKKGDGACEIARRLQAGVAERHKRIGGHRRQKP